MKKITKMLLFSAVLTGMAFSALGDRGIGRKSKSKISLNISGGNLLSSSIGFNLKSGLKYTGSLLMKQESNSNYLSSNTLVTYQKGNTVYILPYKQVITMPEIKPNYTGVKLIIRPH
jgi:hypothetical protein